VIQTEGADIAEILEDLYQCVESRLYIVYIYSLYTHGVIDGLCKILFI